VTPVRSTVFPAPTFITTFWPALASLIAVATSAPDAGVITVGAAAALPAAPSSTAPAAEARQRRRSERIWPDDVSCARLFDPPSRAEGSESIDDK
jgi:hypothetical protein